MGQGKIAINLPARRGRRLLREREEDVNGSNKKKKGLGPEVQRGRRNDKPS